MDLKKYLDLNSIPVADFADRIGVSKEMVYAVMQRTRRFGDDTKIKVVKETRGEVSLADLTLTDDELQREVSNG